MQKRGSLLVSSKYGRKIENILESYPMSLNVKDPEAHRLAQAIARATGQSMTRVVTDALRERLARIQRRNGKASVEELLAIADRAAVHVKQPYVDHAELLYDEHGLPK
jgi:antitoxin VapB